MLFRVASSLLKGCAYRAPNAGGRARAARKPVQRVSAGPYRVTPKANGPSGERKSYRCAALDGIAKHAHNRHTAGPLFPKCQPFQQRKCYSRKKQKVTNRSAQIDRRRIIMDGVTKSAAKTMALAVMAFIVPAHA